ncbi:DNA-binding response OmpR family regulator [Neolewinella xylanilytica]|uniref:DNA-binding response OmpR family regulator n=1 Tax=Neolewinella xylanilytica TaxID=1514080 RepID=A0A2S6I6L5_9BACT|nr:response regulator transcription factor [Neolewinella xylanilytica]PPK87136.1 DNA-binding response OmpR family regulator [Neolewinella xylanilytica]
MSRARILYVEDDEGLGFVTRDNLEINGFEVVHLDSGRVALQAIEAGELHYDLCLLDVMLPGVDGFTLARKIRERDQDIPILFLTAKSLEEDRLQGLRLGADDYITKPFSIEELLLRVEVFLRRNRVRPAALAFDPRHIGHYVFDAEQLQLTNRQANTARRLTRREAELLQLLSGRRETVLERAEILERIWGENDYFLGRSLDVFVSRLRKYLRADPRIKIENIHGVGFTLTVAE